MDGGGSEKPDGGKGAEGRADVNYQKSQNTDHGNQSGTGNGGAQSDDAQFDLRQFVNSASRFPLEEDFRLTPAAPPPSRYLAEGAGYGRGELKPEDIVLPSHGEREPLELCDLPAQLGRSILSGTIVTAVISGIQALLLWMLETAAVWTPRAVEFACRLTAVHLPVLCVGIRDWTTTSAPRLASRAWHVTRVTAPLKLSEAYTHVATVWWPTTQAWANWLWCGLVTAVRLIWTWLQRLTAVRSVFSHTLGLLILGAHRCYNFLMVRFRARFPEAFERMVGAAGTCERRCTPALSTIRLRVFTAWNACLLAILTLVEKAKAAVTGGGGAPRANNPTGTAEQGETETSAGGTTLEGIVLFAATCGRGVRDGSTRLRCMSPLKHRLRRMTPKSGFLAILMLFALGFTCTTLLVYSGSRAEVKPREKPQPVDWQEYIHASRRPRLDGEILKDEEVVDEMGAIEREVGRRNRIKKLRRRKGGDGNSDWDVDDVGWKQVSDVIGLMAKKTDSNATARPVIHKKVLMGQIQLLRDAMMDEKSRLPVLDKPPSCVNDLGKGEVEDILCIPRPKFLSHVKNPCWYAGPRASEDSVPELKCLPYFHILGCAKSGTTDLWNRLMSHPHVISNDGLLHKEALWWSWQRYGIMGYKQRHVMTFDDYVDLFQDTARQIRASMESETLHQQILITGEASPPDFWDFRGWVNISQNRNSNTPIITTPHLMRHMYRDPKFILMFRDPIDRLYSDYFFVGGGLTSEDFHNDVLATIDILAMCVKSHGLQRCFYDRNVYAKLPVRLPFSCYSLYMQEWLQVFPRENFLLLKLEEYKDDLEGTLKSVMEFLGLGPLKEAQLEQIAEEERSRVTAQRKLAGPMQNATLDILHQLLDPCTRAFAKLVGMEKFNWDSPSSRPQEPGDSAVRESGSAAVV